MTHTKTTWSHTMNTKTLSLGVLVIAFLFSGPALAGPEVELTMKAEKVVLDKKGKKKHVEAKNTKSGDTLHYTLSYHNKGDAPALNIKINNPIPVGTAYVSGSAKGKDSQITYSVDRGKSFNKPSLLTYVVKDKKGKSKKRKVSPDLYTDIRWLVAKIPAGAKGKVSFQVTVK